MTSSPHVVRPSVMVESLQIPYSMLPATSFSVRNNFTDAVKNSESTDKPYNTRGYDDKEGVTFSDSPSINDVIHNW